MVLVPVVVLTKRDLCGAQQVGVCRFVLLVRPLAYAAAGNIEGRIATRYLIRGKGCIYLHVTVRMALGEFGARYGSVGQR
jgi:hypothetical protein